MLRQVWCKQSNHVEAPVCHGSTVMTLLSYVRLLILILAFRAYVFIPYLVVRWPKSAFTIDNIWQVSCMADKSSSNDILIMASVKPRSEHIHLIMAQTNAITYVPTAIVNTKNPKLFSISQCTPMYDGHLCVQFLWFSPSNFEYVTRLHTCTIFIKWLTIESRYDCMQNYSIINKYIISSIKVKINNYCDINCRYIYKSYS